MNVPTKQQLRDEIAQLREDLFTMIEASGDADLLYPILERNQWYYVTKFNRDTEREILEKYGKDGFFNNTKTLMQQFAETV